MSRIRPRRVALAVLATLALPVGLWMGISFEPEDIAPYPQSTVLLDYAGRPLRWRLGPDDQDCRPVAAAPESWVCQALVAAEDQRFWRHAGVDPLAIARAVLQNLASGRIVSGASTLSTQVIKLNQPRPRTWWTKLVEAVAALKMEGVVTKRAILEQYLNRAPFGGNLVGVEAASQRYFSKSARDLSLAEAALVVGLPQAPARLRPDRHPAAARARRDYVLGRMVAEGMIPAAQAAQASRQDPVLARAARPFLAPHFCDFVLQRTAPAGRVRTTLDLDLQHAAEQLLAAQAPALRAQQVYGAAIVILEVESGAVRAMVGSPDYDDTRHAGQVNAAARPRSPGSALKPFVYAMALEQGLCTPATTIVDEPLAFAGYDPLNFDRRFVGPVTVREALVQSLNIPAIKLGRQVGIPRLLTHLRGLGLDTLDQTAEHYGLGLVIGDGEVRLLDLVNAYACLARGGTYLPFTTLAGIAHPEATPVFSPATAFLVADMLKGEERLRALCGHNAAVAAPPMAWKTGTSTGFRDAWTIAYNPEYVVGVWLGNPDGQAAEALVGGVLAAPLVYDLFRRLYPDGVGPWYEPPANLRRRDVCVASGLPPGPWCATATEDWYQPGIAPNALCPACADAQATPAATGNTANPASALAIVAPANGAQYRCLQGMETLNQQLALSVTHPDPGTDLYWFVNGRFWRQARADAPLFWSLAPGSWTFVCCDRDGRQDRVSIVVD